MNRDFWRQALSLSGSVTPVVAPRVVVFTALAAIVWLIHDGTDWNLHLPIAPYEAAGAALAVLIVLRTNAGYDRWWEARKLWGGIVNQSRNFAIMALDYGPADETWRRTTLGLTALFPHAARRHLRGQSAAEEARRLAPGDLAARISAARHGALAVAREMATQLRHAVDADEMDRFSFLQADGQRAQLVDHLGACERILKSPLPAVYSIKFRRFLLLYLTTLPFALLDESGALTPLIVALVSYSLLAVDQIGVELENPFSPERLGHLPLDDICNTIEDNVFELGESGSVRTAACT
jgi:putative membrane protein